MSLARSIRWIIRGALIDRFIDTEQVRSDIRLLIVAHIEGASHLAA
jgi:hypothetical protein